MFLACLSSLLLLTFGYIILFCKCFVFYQFTVQQPLKERKKLIEKGWVYWSTPISLYTQYIMNYLLKGYDITSTIVNQALVPRPATHRMRRQAAEIENSIPDLEEVC